MTSDASINAAAAGSVSRRPAAAPPPLPAAAGAADLLRFSGGPWLRRLSLGALLAGVAILLQLVAGGLVWNNHAMVGQTLHVLAAAMMAVGAWILTIEETGGAPQRRMAAGLIGRWSAIAAAALWLLLWIVLVAGRSASMHPLTAMTLCIMAIEALTLSIFLNALAMRAPHDGLATQFQNLAGIMTMVLALLVAVQFIDITAWLTPVFFLVLPLLGALAGLMMWGVVTMLRLSLELWLIARNADVMAARRQQKSQLSPKL